MIKKPWQIWSLFSLCLIAVVMAMLWLSFKTIELDALRETDRIETERARQEAELQERISTALYRMDLRLLPLVSQEASRPHYFYDSFYQPGESLYPDNQLNSQPNSGEPNPFNGPFASPLLLETPQFVKLHFQVRPDDQFSSPQTPSDKDKALAIHLFQVPEASITDNSERLTAVQQFCNYELLMGCCDSIETPEGSQKAGKLAAASSQSVFPGNNAYEVPAVDKILEKIQQAKEYQSDDSRQSETNAAPISRTGNYRGSGGKVAIQRTRSQDRVNEEFNRRRDSTRNFAQQQAMSNNISPLAGGQGGYGGQQFYANDMNQALIPQTSQLNESELIQQGVMQPTWIGENLLLTRRVEGNGEPYFQCCWLDWKEIQTSLREEVSDILPSVEFEPIKLDTELNLGSALTTIPVQLVVDRTKLLSTLSLETQVGPEEQSGLRMALLIAWCGLGLATIASIGLLHGVMKLSERRAAFVSAVTHELRTPLTTFRMYAEMLAEKMVPAEKQQEYTNTLRIQADRLSHLVENVLQFARLERSSVKSSQETVVVGDLVERFASRLQERVFEADMKLDLQIDETTSKIEFETQPSNVEQVLFNLVDNACKYARPSSNDLIELKVDSSDHSVQFQIRDYGPGVPSKSKRLMFRPFHKSDLDAANSAPGVGLGLALCKRMAASLGGRLFYRDLEDGACFVLELTR